MYASNITVPKQVIPQLLFTAVCAKDTLPGAKTQRKCKNLLSEMDGRAGTKPH